MIDVIRDIILWSGALLGFVCLGACIALAKRVSQLETLLYERGLAHIIQSKRRVL